jgi:hypothetical protein
MLDMSDVSALPLFRVVGFSGHRQLHDPAGAASAITAALALLRHELPGDWIGLSSVATGGDQLFVEQVLSLGLSWHAILPLPPREFREDFSPPDWLEAERLLTRASHVLVINENGSREDGYLDCGMETVDGADVLIALWDGEPARGKGGTADVVEYAKSIGKPMLILDAATLAARKENWSALKQGNVTLAELNRLPEAGTGSGENPFKAPDSIYRFQQKCDAAASHGAPQFRLLIVSTVILHVLATIIAATALAFDLEYQLLPWAKLLCLVGALGVAIVLGRRAHSHSSWVRCRLATEFCRSALATWGLPRAAPLFQNLNLPTIRGLTRSLHILHSRSHAARPVSMSDFKEIYIARRLDDQLAYYQRQELRALPLFARLKAGFWIATVFAVLCTLAYAMSDTLRIETPHWVQAWVFHFLPIALPVIAAALISMISINDLQRRVSRYREMKSMLLDSRKQVMFCQTWNSLERIVLRTEHALLQEVLEWHSITSFSESH